MKVTRHDGRKWNVDVDVKGYSGRADKGSSSVKLSADEASSGFGNHKSRWGRIGELSIRDEAEILGVKNFLECHKKYCQAAQPRLIRAELWNSLSRYSPEYTEVSCGLDTFYQRR